MKRALNIIVSALAWAGIVLTGCTNIEPAVSEIEKGQQYTLCIKASKGEPATKTLLFENGQLRSYWAKGDVLRVYDASTESHIVDLVSQEDGEVADFKVALTEAQAGQLTAATALKLVYKSPNYTEQTGTMKSVSDNCDYAIALVSKISVNNKEYRITTDKADFVSQQAIVQFKIENELGKPIDVASLTVTYGSGAGETVTVKVDEKIKVTNEKKEDKYPFVAIPACSGVSLEAVGRDGRTYAFSKGIEVKASNNLLENGYFYPIAVQMHGQPALGDPYYSDGTWAACNKHADGAQVVGIVVYLGSGAIVENYPHGLVMALKDASQGAKWDTKAVEERVSLFGDKVTSTELSLVNYGGKAKTDAMAAGEDSPYAAAKAAKGYNVQVASNKCTGWFLPSSGQWLSVVYGLCGADYPDKSLGTWWKNGNTSGNKLLWGDDKISDIAKVLYPTDANGYAHSLLNAAMKAVSKDYDEIITKKGNYWVSYWTSSENARTYAIRMNFGVEDDTNTGRYSSIKTDNKDKGMQYRVRAFLAF